MDSAQAPSVSPPPPSSSGNRVWMAVLLLFGLVSFSVTAYLLFSQSKPAPKKGPEPTPTPTQQVILPEIIKGQVLSFKDNILAIQKDATNEAKIRVLPGTLVLKQKKLNGYSMGTVPATVSAGNLVSVSAFKNPSGDLETSSVVILDETIK